MAEKYCGIPFIEFIGSRVGIKLVTISLWDIRLAGFIQEFLNFSPFLYLLISNYIKYLKYILN